MAAQFDFDEKKTTDENINDFLQHIASINKPFTQLLCKHLNKMLPLQDSTKQGAARALFNGEIKKQLDASLASVTAKND